jgi:His/Glu/Gln/Arg/opine family amino acid ABC transporter permease subunit
VSWAHLGVLLEGAATTVGVCLLAIALGVPLGLLVAAARIWRVPLLAQVLAVYVSLVRAAPLMTFTLFVFFGLPALGVTLDPLPAAVLILTLNTATFNSEIWRATILDFPRDQLEAAHAVGMTGGLAFRRVVLPQVWRAGLPALTNEMTALIKSSPAIAVIGVVDLTRAAHQIGAGTYRPLPPFVAAVALYAVVLFTLVKGARQLERSLQQRYGTL